MKSKCSIFTILSLVPHMGTAFAPPTVRPFNSATSLQLFGGSKKPATSSSRLTEEALQIYKSKYPGGDGKGYFFDGWGMPDSYTAPDSKQLLFNVREEKLRATFNTIAKLYGEDNALKMVKIQPGVLAFNQENFAPSLDAFGVTFGLEQAQDMVLRNPGLLSVKPANAATADDLTMQLSYVVEVTRPIGLAGPALILALLAVPPIEGALGLSRGELFASFF